MMPNLFAGTDAEDEIWMNRMLPAEKLAAKLKKHRDTYVTEVDFQFIATHGFNMVRIPIPYFVFGDREPFIGCIEYLDRAFDWAEKYGIKILVDLHTVPGSQNGYDNGGITGVCKWCKNPEDVEYALTVLERLAERYGKRTGLFGIEILNEPISFPVYITAPSTGKAKDKEEAKGSGYVPMKFLKSFYIQAYNRLRVVLPEDKAIVFHDGFRLGRWKRFFRKSGMKNILLDTHIYIFAMENFVPIAKPWVYKMFININAYKIKRVNKNIPVVVGEWCICNKYADKIDKNVMEQEEVQKRRNDKFRMIYKLQHEAWNQSAGWIYWNYQLLRDRNEMLDESWKESWDLCRCIQNGWIPGKIEER
ncbi:MAG TPA: cellulase family glycosylhydrolase [Candidatus Merdenecus merdavium]|nr:cellulase family glycosylhydrolase [Candidatus Merdenecus merdavium]